MKLRDAPRRSRKKKTETLTLDGGNVRLDRTSNVMIPVEHVCLITFQASNITMARVRLFRIDNESSFIRVKVIHMFHDKSLSDRRFQLCVMP
jgi:hypothetical protein